MIFFPIYASCNSSSTIDKYNSLFFSDIPVTKMEDPAKLLRLPRQSPLGTLQGIFAWKTNCRNPK